ncbi:MAG: cytochrome c [Candidatus Eisenbacteria bacterium]|nr:cytochrome c [Candidatus Eisenbacteria bacterium]
MRHLLNIRTVGATLLLALVVMGAAIAQAAAPLKGNPAAGKTLYTTKCVACHKADGSGGIKLTGNPTPNWKLPKTWADPIRKNPDVFMRDCIQNGKIKSGMVAWGKTGQLKPQQIEDLIAYIHTIAKKK